MASFTAFLAVLGALLLLPSFPAPLAAGSRDSPQKGMAAAAEAQCHQDGKGPSRCHDLVEMEVRDVIPLKDAQTHAVVLVSKDRGVVLPIFVDEGAAVAIAFRLAHRQSPHPLAHDLLDHVVSELGGTVTEVRIDDVKDQIYFGRVFIDQGKKHLQIEARPSDSISMALTKGAKIYASHKVVAEAGITREQIEQLRNRLPPGAQDDDESPGVGGSGPPPSEQLQAPMPGTPKQQPLNTAPMKEISI